MGTGAREWGMTCVSGQIISKGKIQEYATGANFQRGDIIGVHVDLD